MDTTTADSVIHIALTICRLCTTIIYENNKIKKIRYYQADSGKIPYKEWFDSLKDSTVRQRIRTRLDRVETGNFGDYKILEDGVSELKFKFGAGYRIYFGEFDDYFVILLCGGDKGSQKKDIETAKKYWRDLLERSHE